MNKLLTYILIVILFSLTGCETEIDNYAEPGETITGRIIDAVTGEAVLTEQPNGFQIRYKEVGYSADAPDRYFWGKADGTFQNTKLFSNTYEITPVNGPFIQPETVTIDIHGVTEVDFTVTPYLNIQEARCSLENDVLTVSFRIHRPVAVTSKVANAFIAIDWNPNVGNAINKIRHEINYENIDDADILDTLQTVRVDLSELAKGYTYYTCIGACTSANTSRYNYSLIMEFDY